MDLYHVMNRAVESRRLFLDSQDYARFVHNLYEFNDTVPANNTSRHAMNDLVGRSLQREQLVDIHGWCLMEDHYHLLLSERVDGGLQKFLMKLNVGYAKYYNDRYKRTGFVFRGRTKKVHLEHHAHFLYILHYIHLNPLDYVLNAKDWRIRSKGSFEDARAALQELSKYRWSSYLDYAGTRNFPSVIAMRLFKSGHDGYVSALKEYLEDTERASLQSLE
jgi:putative transposase